MASQVFQHIRYEEEDAKDYFKTNGSCWHELKGPTHKKIHCCLLFARQTQPLFRSSRLESFAALTGLVPNNVEEPQTQNQNAI